MRTLSYYIEPSAELALNVLIERIPCFADWRPLEEDESYIVVTITCRQEDTVFVEYMLAQFV